MTDKKVCPPETNNDMKGGFNLGSVIIAEKI